MTHFDANVIAAGVAIIAIVKVCAVIFGRPN